MVTARFPEPAVEPAMREAGAAKHALTLLTRLASRNPAMLSQLEHALIGRLDTLGSVAIEVATEAGDPMGVALGEAIRQGVTPALAERLRLLLPDASVALRETAVELERRALDQLVADGTAGMQREIAIRLSRLALRLRELDRIEEALNAAEQAVTHARRVAQARPGFEDDVLASCLERLSYLLRVAGRVIESLAPAEESIGLTRKHAEDEASRSQLASALDNFGNALDDIGSSEEAVVAAEEAVGLYDVLASGAPGKYRASRAGALMHLARHRAALSRYDEALPVATEAVELHRALSDRSPDTYQQTLCSSLTLLSGILGNLDRIPEALQRLDEAAAIYRHLAELRPRVFEPQLSASLHNRASLLRRRGGDEALAAAYQAADAARPLVSNRPDAFVGQLAGSLGLIGAALAQRGEFESAAAYYEKGFVIFTPAFLREPTTTSVIMLDLVSGYLSAIRKLKDPPPYSPLLLLLVQAVSPFMDDQKEDRAIKPTAFSFNDSDVIALPKLLFEESLAAARRHADEPAVRWTAASAGLGLASRYGKQGDVRNAAAVTDQMVRLAEDHSGDSYLRNELAVALQDLVTVMLQENCDQAQILPHYDGLKALGLAHPAEPGLRRCMANAVVTLLNRPASQKIAEDLYGDLQVLAAEYPSEPELAEAAAKGAINLIIVCGEAGEPGAAARAYDDVRRYLALRNRADFRGWVASSAFNLINACYVPGRDLPNARARYDDLSELARNYPDEDDILTRYAEGFTVMVRAYCREDQLEMAENLVAEFSASMPVTQDCRLAQVEAFAVMVGATAGKGLFTRASRFYQALGQSVAQTGYDEAFAYHQALAGIVLAISLARAGRAEQASTIRGELLANKSLAQQLRRVIAENDSSK
jgi:tetratricopeptide (TPR) repeat protein